MVLEVVIRRLGTGDVVVTPINDHATDRQLILVSCGVELEVGAQESARTRDIAFVTRIHRETMQIVLFTLGTVTIREIKRPHAWRAALSVANILLEVFRGGVRRSRKGYFDVLIGVVP